MDTYRKVPDKGDPSDILQLFPKYNIQLLCCRYWWLRKWEFQELSYPYWRIYKNDKEGAVLISNGIEYEMTPDKIFIISPNTSYSTRLKWNKKTKTGYSIEGGRVVEELQIPSSEKDNVIFHLFIHFNNGFPYDNMLPGIYSFDLTPHLNKKLSIITNHLIVDNSRFSFYTGLAIQSLISDLLSDIPESRWDLLSKDYRILDVLRYIDNHMKNDLSNHALAQQVGLATNAFTRLFKQEVNISPQRFVKKKRIDKACVLLHHSDKSIDSISDETGFADRYHFSRIFKQVTEVSPAKYRKEFGI
jgi:AraC-like DNA-binding protein